MSTKKSKYSSWHGSGVYARDMRATKDPEPQVGKHRSSKNTRKWCKGKVGKEHKGIWVVESNRTTPRWFTLVCENCNKHLDYCWPFSHRIVKCKCGFHK